MQTVNGENSQEGFRLIPRKNFVDKYLMQKAFPASF